MKLIHVNLQRNNKINKIIITEMAKNTSSTRSAFFQHQFKPDAYHNSTCIAAESTPHS